MTFSYEKAREKYDVTRLRTLANLEFFGFEGVDASLQESLDYGAVTVRDEECGCTVVLIRPRNSVPRWSVLFLEYDFDPYKAWAADLNWDGIRSFVGDPRFPVGRPLADVLLAVDGYCGLGVFLNRHGPLFEIDDYAAEQKTLKWKTCLTERDVRGDGALPVWVRIEDDAGCIRIKRGWARRSDDGISVDLEGGEQLMDCDEVPGPNDCMFAERTVL